MAVSRDVFLYGDGTQQGLNMKNPEVFNWAMNKPGVIDVLHESASRGWSAETQQAWLMNTTYWVNTTESARAWDLLSENDPAEANKRLTQVIRQTTKIAGGLGYNFDTYQYEYMDFVNQAARENWSPDQVREEIAMKMGLRAMAGNGYVQEMYQKRPGEFGALVTGVSKMASDYGVPRSQDQTFWNALDLMSGKMTQDAIKQDLTNWAKGYYSGNEAIITALDQGMTVRQFADPYLQMAVQQLEINPNEILLTDPKWQKAWNYVNPEGVKAPMNLADWQKTIRNDQSYGFDTTSNARTTSAQLTKALAQQFGATG